MLNNCCIVNSYLKHILSRSRSQHRRLKPILVCASKPKWNLVAIYPCLSTYGASVASCIRITLSPDATKVKMALFSGSYSEWNICRSDKWLSSDKSRTFCFIASMMYLDMMSVSDSAFLFRELIRTPYTVHVKGQWKFSNWELSWFPSAWRNSPYARCSRIRLSLNASIRTAPYYHLYVRHVAFARTSSHQVNLCIKRNDYFILNYYQKQNHSRSQRLEKKLCCNLKNSPCVALFKAEDIKGEIHEM